MERNSRKHLTPILLAAAMQLNACGGNSDSEDQLTTTNLLPSTGIFFDSPVSGLRYRTNSLSGTTNSKGEFNYFNGESITFSVGNIDLPSTMAKDILSPLDLSSTKNISDTQVVNIVRFLQSIDNDSNPENGIQVDDSMHNAAHTTAQLDFSSESFADHTALREILDPSSTNDSILIETDIAIEHFGNTLSRMVSFNDESNYYTPMDGDFFFLVYADKPYTGHTLLLSRKSFNLSTDNQSKGRLSVSNNVWHLADQKNKNHIFIIASTTNPGQLSTCWGSTPEIAAECGNNAARVYLFKDESEAIIFQQQSETQPVIVNETQEQPELTVGDSLVNQPITEPDVITNPDPSTATEPTTESETISISPTPDPSDPDSEISEEVLGTDLLVELDPASVECDASLSQLKAAILKVTNESRAQAQMCGTYSAEPVQDLTWYDTLAESSRLHSIDMTTYGFFSHVGSDGLSPAHRIWNAGFPQGGYVGENIAGGQKNVDSVHRALMASSGHCRNIMSTYFTHVGAACVLDETNTPIWTFNFGQIR